MIGISCSETKVRTAGSFGEAWSNSASSETLFGMADVGMSRNEATALAKLVHQATGHITEVQPEDHSFVVQVRRNAPDDVWYLRDEADWQWLEPQIRESN